MDALISPVLKSYLTLGGGYVLAVIFIALYIWSLRALQSERSLRDKDRESKDELYDKVIEMSEKQTRASTEVAGVLRENDKTLDHVVATLNILTDRRNR